MKCTWVRISFLTHLGRTDRRAVSLGPAKKKEPPNGDSLFLAGPTGFEPAISSVTGRRDRPSSLRARVQAYTAVSFYLLAKASTCGYASPLKIAFSRLRSLDCNFVVEPVIPLEAALFPFPNLGLWNTTGVILTNRDEKSNARTVLKKNILQQEHISLR